jgi:hypothetical protein
MNEYAGACEAEIRASATGEERDDLNYQAVVYVSM